MSLVSKYERYFTRARTRRSRVRTSARRPSDIRQQAHRRGLRVVQAKGVVYVFKPTARKRTRGSK